MRYEPVPDRDWHELCGDVTGSDTRNFVDASRIAAYHRSPQEFDQLLRLATERPLNTTEQWGIAEAIVVMIQMRGVLPDRARSTLLAMKTTEPATGSRTEALELIQQHQRR